MKAYIIKSGKLIVAIESSLPSGTPVSFAFNKAIESINANREFNLVNATRGKISRSKKYYEESLELNCCATEINPREFYIQEYEDGY